MAVSAMAAGSMISSSISSETASEEEAETDIITMKDRDTRLRKRLLKQNRKNQKTVKRLKNMPMKSTAAWDPEPSFPRTIRNF